MYEDTSRIYTSKYCSTFYVCMLIASIFSIGKSRIHGFGIFAKQPHKAGDMVLFFLLQHLDFYKCLQENFSNLLCLIQVIEYTGELVRPPVADRREHLIYNSLVVSEIETFYLCVCI